MYLEGWHSTKERRVFKCELCNGDPQCIPACKPGALSFIEPDEIGMTRRDELSRKLIMEQIATLRG